MVKQIQDKGKWLLPFIAIFAVIGLGTYQLIKTGEVSSEVFLILGGVVLRNYWSKFMDKE